MNHTEKKALEAKAINAFMDNPSWKEEYDKAPSTLMKLYTKVSFIWSYYAEDEAIDEYYTNIGKRLEKSFTNIEWSYMLAGNSSNIAKAHWYKNFKFNHVKELKHRVIFHVPHKSYLDGQFVSVDYKAFEKKLVDMLQIDSCYISKAVGKYEGRCYPEHILTVYCDDDTVETIHEIFKKVIATTHYYMRQQSYAYEIDNKMILITI